MTILSPADISQRVMQEAAQAQSNFKEAMDPSQYSSIVEHSRSTVEKAAESSSEHFLIQHYYKDATAESLRCKGADRREDQAVYYFFSFSMPEGRLKEVMKEAAKNGVVMVLIGMHGDSLQATAKKLSELSGGINVSFTIDPVLYEQFDIRVVPTIVMQSSDKTVRTIKGDISIKYALEKFNDGGEDDFGVLGPIYTIAERDMLSVIYSRVEKTDWNVKAEEIKKKAFNFSGYEIPKAQKGQIYFVNPSIILSKDILDHTGKVVFKAGTTVNPATVMPLTGKYIFFDGTDDQQVAFAMKSDYRKLIITKGDILALAKKFNKPFYRISDILIERFAISAVPSVVSQAGEYVKVEQIALDAGEAR